MLPEASSNPLAYYCLLAFCLLLGGGLVVTAWRRSSRRQRGVRMLAGAAAAGALWLTAYPPRRAVPTTPEAAIVLTPGYQPDTLQQLLRRLGPGTAVWNYGATPPAGKARPLLSLLTLAGQPGLQQVHVLGLGLPAADAPALGSVAVHFHQDAVFAGFQAALWKPRLMLGEVLQVEGRVKGTPSTAWVSLRAAGAVRDSFRLPAGQGGFRLRYQPKAAGRTVYELVLRQNGRVRAAEPVPVEISLPLKPAVLLLAATPSFELKFLKNHLADAHYPVALRSTVSRGQQQTEFVNQPARSLARLTPALLSQYAVLVADAAALAALSQAEAQSVQAALSAGRLGLIALAGAGTLPRSLPALADFRVQPRSATQAPGQYLRWPEAPAKLRATLPAQLRPALSLRPLATGPQAVVVAAARRVGLGFAVVSVLPETFPWVLQGQSAGYASFWNRLLTAAVPPATPAATWRVAPRWPRPHQPASLQLTAFLPEVLPQVKALADGPAVRLALRQDTRLPEWSEGSFWPATPGWHEIRGPGAARHAFYVYPESAWAGPELQARRLAMAQRPAQALNQPVPIRSEMQDLPAMWFFVLFLLAAGYLWLEEKL